MISVIELTDEQKNEYTQAFEIFDKDKDGMISRQELKTIMRSMGQKPTDSDIDAIFQNVGGHGNNLFSYDEFIQFVTRQISSSKDIDELVEAFSIFDVDKDGFITKSELRDVMNRIGENLSDEQLNIMIHEADKDGDGKISIKEFKKLMQ